MEDPDSATGSEVKIVATEMQISLKLLVDTKANKVLFAEAGKEFVDFIFHIMSLPLGTVVKLLNQKKMVGCLGDLYKSVESLNNQYFQSDLNKDSVLNPKTAVNVPLLSLNEAPNANTSNKFYRCDRCNKSNNCNRYEREECYADAYDDECSYSYITDFQGKGMKCNNCSYGTMSTEVKYIKPEAGPVNTTSSSSGGYVKGVVTYMVMDNLEVKPMSTISGITLINKFHVKDVTSLEEKEVQVCLKEGLALLEASLETKAVLTLVFLGKKI